MYKPTAAQASLPADLPVGPVHNRQSSRSNSVSSLKRSASLKDTVPDPTKPNKKPVPSSARRRSSVAHVSLEAIGAVREGVGNLNRWSQSTASSKASSKEKAHSHQPSLSRRLSINNNSSLASTHGSAPHPSSPNRLNSSPSRRPIQPSTRSPASSPHRRARPRSPVYQPPSSVTAPPQLPSLPLLPATVYNPSSPNTSAADSPSGGLFSTNPYLSNNTDYFNSKPRPSLSTNPRPPSRNNAAGKSPLGSPPIGVLESEARHRSNLSGSRLFTANHPSTAHSRDPFQNAWQTPVRERSGSRDQEYRIRSESNASNRLDDGYQGTPPRTRERRERDKKTMLARALQKANTAVLLDNAQNFEGAMEAYGDACRLLSQVMVRSSGDEDKRKLDAIVSCGNLPPWFCA